MALRSPAIPNLHSAATAVNHSSKYGHEVLGSLRIGSLLDASCHKRFAGRSRRSFDRYRARSNARALLSGYEGTFFYINFNIIKLLLLRPKVVELPDTPTFLSFIRNGKW